jgi:GNAT superfamily N-acetyltransferase
VSEAFHPSYQQNDSGIRSWANGSQRRAHRRFCTQVGLLVEDRWQGLGVGADLVEHLAGVAQVAGFAS